MPIPLLPFGVSQLPYPPPSAVVAGVFYGPIDDPIMGTWEGGEFVEGISSILPVVIYGPSVFTIPDPATVRLGVIYGDYVGTNEGSGIATDQDDCTEQYSPADWLKNDWQWVEGVSTAGFGYGPQTATENKGEAPASGVRVRRGNPTQEQIAVAASTVGYESTDQIFTIWSNTLREDPEDESSTRVVPTENDRILHCNRVWIIKWVKETMYDTQYIAYCRLSTKTPHKGVNIAEAC